jgi:glycosyltransferase involved in cell wall biosynthesis
MVSCITITRNRPKLLLQSVFMFKHQTYKEKEMIVIYYSSDLETKAIIEEIKIREDNIHFYEYDETLNFSLGDLRNFAISKSTADYICVWDDDDIFHPLRIETQIDALKNNSDKVACTLKRESKWIVERNLMGITPYREDGWENSLICKRIGMPTYADLNCGEDTPVLKQLFSEDKVISIDYPELYVYVYHGTNTVSKNHYLEIGDSRSRQNQRNVIKSLIYNFTNTKNYIK